MNWPGAVLWFRLLSVVLVLIVSLKPEALVVRTAMASEPALMALVLPMTKLTGISTPVAAAVDERAIAEAGTGGEG